VRLLRQALAGLGLVRGTLAVRFWSFVAHLRLRMHGATVGGGLRVRGPLRLYCHRTGRIRIGDDCRIQSGFAGNPVGGSSRMAIWVGPAGRLSVGDRVGMSNSTIVCMDSVTIEDEVFIGGGSSVYDTNFHSLDAGERSRPGNPGARTAPVTIRRRAFVGGHAILLKGAAIGEAAVIGAGAVVRSVVPDGETWFGNPARPVPEPQGKVARPPRPADGHARAAG
jgi:acetyltransferase-like isoleucine patch superfamily enzyme